ncbi:MAG: hypothetical protein AAF530_17965 [Pseudomonadota bacterium]
MGFFKRRSASSGFRGRLKAKNRDYVTPSYWNTEQPLPMLDKERPGQGYRHILRREDLYAFIEMIPNWDELAKGLDGVLLAPGDPGCFGWYDQRGIVGLCAWERGLWVELPRDFYDQEIEVFQRLGVEVERRKKWVLCKFSEPQAKAYQLLNIFLHELGHHHDRMTTKSKLDCARGEPYADAYALRYEAEIWDSYLRRFELM